MDIDDIKAVVGLLTQVTIVDTLGDRLYAGKAEDIPRDMLDMMVEGLAPGHDYHNGMDFLWIEVL